MSICPHTRHAGRCQPQEGVMCPYGATSMDWKDAETRPCQGAATLESPINDASASFGLSPDELADEAAREAISAFRKATFEFARSLRPEDSELMKQAQRHLFQMLKTPKAPVPLAIPYAYVLTSKVTRERDLVWPHIAANYSDQSYSKTPLILAKMPEVRAGDGSVQSAGNARTPAEADQYESLMRCWDQWRAYLAGGGTASWPRDGFESLLDDYFAVRSELAQLRKRLGSLGEPGPIGGGNDES